MTDPAVRADARTPARRLVSAGLRRSVVTVDQLVFSAITFALQLVLAANSTAAEFGVFALVAMVQIGLWYLGRGLSSEALLVSRVVARAEGAQVRGAAATALGLGSLAGVGCVAAAWFLGGLAADLLLIQAIACPFTAVLDHSRYVHYARGRAVGALALDAAWLGMFLLGSVCWILTSELGVVQGYLVWGLSVIPCAVVAAATTGSPLSPRDIGRWLSAQRKLIPGFVIDAVYLASGTSAVFALTAWLVGIGELGLLRKALIPVTALIVLFIGVSTSMLAHLAGRGVRDVLRAPARITLAAALVCAACACVTWFLPAGIPSAVLGAPWSRLRPLVLILLGYAFVQTAGQLVMIAVKASGRAWLGPLIRTVQFASEVGLVAGLGIAFGLYGVALGMIGSWILATVLAWAGLLAHRTRPADTESVRCSPNASG